MGATVRTDKHDPYAPILTEVALRKRIEQARRAGAYDSPVTNLRWLHELLRELADEAENFMLEVSS